MSVPWPTNQPTNQSPFSSPSDQHPPAHLTISCSNPIMLLKGFASRSGAGLLRTSEGQWAFSTAYCASGKNTSSMHHVGTTLARPLRSSLFVDISGNGTLCQGLEVVLLGDVCAFLCVCANECVYLRVCVCVGGVACLSAGVLASVCACVWAGAWR